MPVAEGSGKGKGARFGWRWWGELALLVWLLAVLRHYLEVHGFYDLVTYYLFQ
jgi:hypothetical protein